MRLQILANGHDVARDGAQVLHQVDDFVERFAKSDHDAALGQHAAVFAIAPRRGALQQRQRLLVDSVGSDAAIKSRDRFGVVIQHVGLRVEHRVERRFVAIEIRNQNFDFAVRIQRAHLANRLGPVSGAAVRQIVAIN